MEIAEAEYFVALKYLQTPSVILITAALSRSSPSFSLSVLTSFSNFSMFSVLISQSKLRRVSFSPSSESGSVSPGGVFACSASTAASADVGAPCVAPAT